MVNQHELREAVKKALDKVLGKIGYASHPSDNEEDLHNIVMDHIMPVIKKSFTFREYSFDGVYGDGIALNYWTCGICGQDIKNGTYHDCKR